MNIGDRVETINGVGTLRNIRPQTGYDVYEVQLDGNPQGFGCGESGDFTADEMEPMTTTTQTTPNDSAEAPVLGRRSKVGPDRRAEIKSAAREAGVALGPMFREVLDSHTFSDGVLAEPVDRVCLSCRRPGCPFCASCRRAVRLAPVGVNVEQAKAAADKAYWLFSRSQGPAGLDTGPAATLRQVRAQRAWTSRRRRWAAHVAGGAA